MKKKKNFFLLAIIIICTIPLTAKSDSDGNLQLDSDIIITENKGESISSDFPIRSNLFSEKIKVRINEKEKEKSKVTQHIKKINFDKNSENRLYSVNYEGVKNNLFDSYSHNFVGSDTMAKQNSNAAIFTLLFLAIPLFLLSSWTAKKFVRRKRKGKL